MGENEMKIKPFTTETHPYPGAQGFITDFDGSNWIVFPPNIKGGVGNVSVVAYFGLEHERDRLSAENKALKASNAGLLEALECIHREYEQYIVAHTNYTCTYTYAQQQARAAIDEAKEAANAEDD